MFNIKNGLPNIVFKTLPGPKINRVELGGALATVRSVVQNVKRHFSFILRINLFRDKIFVGSGSEARGFTKKGKMFLQFETNLSEPIQEIYGINFFFLGFKFIFTIFFKYLFPIKSVHIKITFVCSFFYF